MTVFGIHTNAQNKPLRDLLDVWRHADALGFRWISLSDHFPGSLGPLSNEAVAAHAALACTTSRATCAVLCYSVGFRHPAVLATAATTIDHLSGGRAAIGLGSGALARDYELYGFPYPPLRVRTDMLDEAVQCVARLLHEESVDFEGRHFTLRGAAVSEPPVQARLPVWVGTTGPRGLRIAAAHADGWNGPAALEEFKAKRALLREACESIGRDPAEVRCSVNPILVVGDASQLPEARRAAALTGPCEQVLEGIARYEEAGADQVNFFLPHPWDLDGLAELAAALGLEPAA